MKINFPVYILHVTETIKNPETKFLFRDFYQKNEKIKLLIRTLIPCYAKQAKQMNE